MSRGVVGLSDLQRSQQPQPFSDSAIPKCILYARGAGADFIGPNKTLYHSDSHACDVLIRAFHYGTQVLLINPSGFLLMGFFLHVLLHFRTQLQIEKIGDIFCS